MNEKLKSLLSATTDESLFAWTDPKMVGRAYGYLEKVEGLSYIEGQGIVAKVHGTEDYYTRVFCDGGGNLESECSCPVGHRCKHAVAMVICASRQLGKGVPIEEYSTDCGLWQSATKAFEMANERLLERERKILEQRAAKEREEAELLRWQEERRASSFALFRGFLGKINECHKNGNVKGVLDGLDEACAATSDDFDRESYGGELYDLIEEMSRIAIEAINTSDMPDKDKILFAHDAETPYRYYASPRLLYDGFWDEQKASAFSQKVWSDVGDALRSRLDDSTFVEGCGFHVLCHTVNDACDAYWRADRGEDAFKLRKRFAARTDNWCECADDLCRLGQRDEAKSFLLEARDFVRGPDSEDWDDGNRMIHKLAEIHAGEGNFAYAAALLAENWLALVGGIDHCGDWYTLEHILDMAEKAGCRQEVFAAIAHAIDTLIPPNGVPFTKEQPRFPLRIRHSPPLAPKEQPPWPLPPTGIDMDVPSPLFTIDAHWWEAEKVLIRVAIREGWLDEASRRYFALPSRPGCCFRVSNEDNLTDFEREVHKALSEKYPKVAAKIAATQECREWGLKHLGERLPKEMKERLFPQMNIPLSNS